MNVIFRNVPIPQLNVSEGRLWPKLTSPKWDKFHNTDVQRVSLHELTALDYNDDVINTWEPKVSDVTWSGVGTSIIIAMGLIISIACLLNGPLSQFLNVLHMSGGRRVRV